jgi:hypothetical protein
MLFTSVAQEKVFLYDDFSTTSYFLDLSKNYFNYMDSSAFRIDSVEDAFFLKYNAIRVKDTLTGLGGYATGQLAAHTCIDYALPVIDRSGDDTIIIEFDVLMDNIASSGNDGRMDVFLIYEYPQGGPVPSDVTNSSNHPYGRPAYDIRIHNGSNGAGFVIGGGESTEGEFNFFNGTNWLPGFLAADPGNYTSQWLYGYSPDQMYPNELARWRSSQGTSPASTMRWTHYAVKVTQDSLTLYTSNSVDSTMGTWQVTAVTPPHKDSVAFINQRYGTAVTSLFDIYKYYPEFNAVRFYWRTAKKGENVSLANVRMSNRTAVYSSILKFKNDFSPVIHETAGSYDIEFLVERPSPSQPI